MAAEVRATLRVLYQGRYPRRVTATLRGKFQVEDPVQVVEVSAMGARWRLLLTLRSRLLAMVPRCRRAIGNLAEAVIVYMVFPLVRRRRQWSVEVQWYGGH